MSVESVNYIAYVRMYLPDSDKYGAEYIGVVGFTREEARSQIEQYLAAEFTKDEKAELKAIWSDEEWYNNEGEHIQPEDLDLVFVAG